VKETKIVIGTRGSALALAQAQAVADALSAFISETVELRVIVTKGDKDFSSIPVGDVGKAWFTAEIERALIDGEIDLAVHSYKDLPAHDTPMLATLPVLERADPRDALVCHVSTSFASLPVGAVVGTDSVRRRAALLRLRPDLLVRSVRGNVGTRLRKLADEPYDALMLAAAGLQRLDLAARISYYFETSESVPAATQGVLAAQYRANDVRMEEALRPLIQAQVALAVEVERAFSAVVGGGCKQPVGCFAQPNGSRLNITGMVGGNRTVVRSVVGSAMEAVELAKALAQELLIEAAL
jgi:hydroxymethylbilane synthase